MPVIQLSHVGCRYAGRVDPDHVITDFLVSGDWKVDTLGNQQAEAGWIHSEAGQLGETKRWHPATGQHHCEPGWRAEEDGWPLVGIGHSTMPWTALMKMAILVKPQYLHLRFKRPAMQLVGTGTK